MKVKVYYNEEQDRYLYTILKNGEIEVARRPEYGRYWNIENYSDAVNFGRYNKTNGEMLEAAGYIPIDVTIDVVEEE